MTSKVTLKKIASVLAVGDTIQMVMQKTKLTYPTIRRALDELERIGFIETEVASRIGSRGGKVRYIKKINDEDVKVS